MIQDKKTIELVKIMELIKGWDPRTWRREYPPKILYKDRKISSKVVRAHLKNIFNDRAQKIGAYFHIPFCKSRCGFCEFYSVMPCGKAIDNYLNLLDKELALYGVNFKKNSLDNLYLGGGTPSLLNKKQISVFFKIVRRHFKIKNSTKIMTEGTPETSTLDKLKLFKESGVDRYTIGAQCFDDYVLKLSGRLHSVRDIYRAFSNVRRAGIKYINLDILLGLHGETEKTYHATLQGILDLKPDCVSFMIFDQGRGVSRNYAKKTDSSYFWEKSLKPNIFMYLNYGMERAGYVRAEGFAGSIYVLRGREKSVNRNILNRNNLNPVVGFGVSAESSLPNLKYLNEPSLREYAESITSGRRMGYCGVELTQDDAIRRYVIYRCIFLGKLNKFFFQLRFKKKIESVFQSKFSVLMKENRFIDAGEDIIFSPDRIFEIAYPDFFTKKQNYSKQEYFFLSCLKYFYSPEIMSKLKKLIL